MKDLLCDEFQDTVNNCLVRHKSILNMVAKFQEANARINRAIFKSATTCGCITVHAEKPEFPADVNPDFSDLKEIMETHVEGELCEECRETLENEIGNLFFYLAALCNVFDLNLYDILIKEHKRLNTLGVFRLS